MRELRFGEETSLALATQMVYSEPGRRCVWGGMGVQFLVEGTEGQQHWTQVESGGLGGGGAGGDSRKFGQSIDRRVTRASSR